MKSSNELYSTKSWHIDIDVEVATIDNIKDMCEDPVDDGMVAGEWLVRTDCQGDNIVGGVR